MLHHHRSLHASGLFFVPLFSFCHPGIEKSLVTFLKTQSALKKNAHVGGCRILQYCCSLVTTGYLNNTERYVEDNSHSPVVGKNCFSCISFREPVRLIKMIN